MQHVIIVRFSRSVRSVWGPYQDRAAADAAYAEWMEREGEDLPSGVEVEIASLCPADPVKFDWVSDVDYHEPNA